jgi:hypothetical protein
LIRQGYQTVDYLAYLRLEIARVEALHKRKDDKKHKDKVNNGKRSSTSRAFKLPSLVKCIMELLHNTDCVLIRDADRVSVISDSALLKPKTLSV